MCFLTVLHVLSVAVIQVCAVGSFEEKVHSRRKKENKTSHPRFVMLFELYLIWNQLFGGHFVSSYTGYALCSFICM